jgi:hypothetical protein
MRIESVSFKRGWHDDYENGVLLCKSTEGHFAPSCSVLIDADCNVVENAYGIKPNGRLATECDCITKFTANTLDSQFVANRVLQ